MNIVNTLLHTLSKPNAYLDPGSGSIILQLILAGIFGVGVVVKVFWKKIIKLFRPNKQADIDAADPTEIFDDDDQN